MFILQWLTNASFLGKQRAIVFLLALVHLSSRRQRTGSGVYSGSSSSVISPFLRSEFHSPRGVSKFKENHSNYRQKNKIIL